MDLIIKFVLVWSWRI